MSRTTQVSAKKRKLEEGVRGKTSKSQKRFKKQKRYHSSSEDEDEVDTGFKPVNLADSDGEQPAKKRVAKPRKETPAQKKPLENVTQNQQSTPEPEEKPESSSGEDENQDEPEDEEQPLEQLVEEEEAPVSESRDSSDDEDDSESEADSNALSTTRKSKPRSKRNDPDAFATSISKILSTKLSASSRADPVLSRSVEAAKARAAASSGKLDAKAQARLRAEKLTALQRGRTTDVLGIERGIAGEVAEKEKQLRKIGTKGVIQLFNAFRAAHDRAEEARKEERRKGTVGMGERQRKVNEVSKESFLELIGGKKKATEAT